MVSRFSNVDGRFEIPAGGLCEAITPRGARGDGPSVMTMLGLVCVGLRL